MPSLPSSLPSSPSNAVLSTRSFSTYFFAFRFALNSDLSIFSTFTFDQTSGLGLSYKTSANNRMVVLEHLHHLVWIQSHTRNWLQHLLCILNQLSPRLAYFQLFFRSLTIHSRCSTRLLSCNVISLPLSSTQEKI